MLGTKTFGRALIFGAGYVVGTRAGRARYDQIQKAAVALAGQVREQLQEPQGASPASVVGAAARRAWDDSDIKLGRS
jgi:hypothetical protein